MVDTALHGLLRDLQQLDERLSRIRRSAWLRRLRDDLSQHIRMEIEQLLKILHAFLTAPPRRVPSSTRSSQLQRIVQDAAALRDILQAMHARPTVRSLPRWLPPLSRLVRSLGALNSANTAARRDAERAASVRKVRSLKEAAPGTRSPRGGIPARAEKRVTRTRKKGSGGARKKIVRSRPIAVAAPRLELAGTASRGAAESTVEAPATGARRARESKRATRYANSTVLDARGRRLAATTSLRPRQAIRVRIDIGALSAESHVSPGPAFPDETLPGDVHIDVMISSTDFAVQDAKGGPDATVAHGQFFLPGNGAPAVAGDGTRFITFGLTAPAKAVTARCRIGFYYRNTLVQSQQLTAAIGRSGGFTLITDFTVSRDLTNLARIPDRPRLSMLTNLNQQGVHQIVLRAVDPGSGAIKARTFVVREETVGPTVSQIRTVLSARAPTARQRRRNDLITDLKQLATQGWTLYTQMAAQNLDALDVLRTSPSDYVVQILRPATSGFVVPWSLTYEIPLLSDNPPVCPLVSEWQDSGPLIEGSPRTCPHGPHTEDVLCPFGFWGFRYAIEQLSSSDDPVLEIQASADSRMVVAETQVQVDLAKLETHVTTLRTLLRKALPAAELLEGKDKSTIRTLIGQDLPIVYFFCHGQRKNIADPDTWLAVGKNEMLTAKDVIGWVVAWRLENKVIWNKVRPLIFVNACHSLAVYPTTLVSYLDAFVGTARAAGVIGTEVKVNPALASSFAERFFELLLTESQSVESALRTIRFEYLAVGNLFGLVYTPYCWSDLRITRASS